MRFLLKVSFSTQAGNAAAENGFKVVQKLLDQQKPEAAYFVAENGRRTGLLIVNMDDVSQLPAICEPWFLALGAEITVVPAMVPDDLRRASPAIEQAVRSYAA